MRRTGKCLRCGECCKTVVIELFNDEEASPDERSRAEDFLAWAAAHKGIRIQRDGDRAEMVMEAPCQFLGFDSRGLATCSKYKDRFGMCRRFPEKPAARCKGFRFER